MSSDPIRWGVLSTGHIAGVFAADLKLLPDHRLAAVASRTQPKADAFAAEFGDAATTAHPTYTALAADPDVDIVYIATPHSEHHANARLCLEAGKHVLCEKAMTVNAAECADLMELAAERGLFLMEAMWMRTNPLHHKLIELLHDGVIGTVHAVSAELGFTVDDPAHRLRDIDRAGGALLDMGVYPLTFAWEVLGAATSVQAYGLMSGDVDGTIGVTLGYADAIATVATSIEVNMPARGVVMGSEGWVELDGFHAARSFVVRRFDADPQTHSVTWPGMGYTYEAAEAARCVRSGLLESPMVPMTDTLAIMGQMDEIRRQIGMVYPRERDTGIPSVPSAGVLA
jgi:predicted dehydrogenase